MTTKSEILEEIKRTALANGGTPLGAARFERDTGIKAWEWAQHWARFGDAVTEAGFKPNQFQGALPDAFLIEKIIGITRKLGKFPTFREIEVERRSDSELPSSTAFQRLGSKTKLAEMVSTYCLSRSGFEDVTALCEPVLRSGKVGPIDGHKTEVAFGEVYLFKSGKYYKVGRTNDTVRRGKEIRIQLPEKMTLIHSIKTDDPSGIEAYWHRRFESKRMNGEWFDLNATDIRAFKRWRKIS